MGLEVDGVANDAWYLLTYLLAYLLVVVEVDGVPNDAGEDVYDVRVGEEELKERHLK
tara:strand:+ start:273 stop:443 length:171 start_codon:yes stop_codon:yes gene_type:complete